MRDLILLRGLPGSGKTTVAYGFGVVPISADDYFYDDDGNYYFNARELPKAHKQCFVRVEGMMMSDEPKIVVANTFTQEWEFKEYYELAKQYGYRVHSLIVENRHGSTNVHNVPKEKLEQMKERFVIKL